MSNAYRRLIALLPTGRIDKGQVISADATSAVVELMTGAQIRVRGTAAVGNHVWIRDGQITGPAPSLTGTDQYV